MKIIHRISIQATPEIQRELATFGILVDRGLATFEVDEASGSWPSLRRWVVERDALDVVRTQFTKSEVLGAPWLVLVPDWHHGYPQPEDDYLTAIYDLSAYCAECGVGAVQKAPFKMKSEPRWGRRGILQLHWIFDEFFVRPEIWQSVFRPRGVPCMPVLNRAGKELKTVLQLDVQTAPVEVPDCNLSVQKCHGCARLRYAPVVRGYFPRPSEKPSSHMTKTKQYFGDGAVAYKMVLVSQEISTALTMEKVLGASFKPIEGTETVPSM